MPFPGHAQQYSLAICALSKINSQATFSGAESPLKRGGEDSGDLPEMSDSSPSTHFHGPAHASTLHHSIGPENQKRGPRVRRLSNVSPVACVTPACMSTRPLVPSSLHESPATAARPTPRITLPRLSIPEILPRQRTSLCLPKGAPPEIGGPSRRSMNRRLLPTPNNLETKLFSLFQKPCSDDDFLPLPLLDPMPRIVGHSNPPSDVLCVVWIGKISYVAASAMMFGAVRNDE